MTDARALVARLATDIAPREIDEDILDVTAAPPRAHYDFTAPAYDVLVGSTLWHKLLWKTTPAAFRKFAEQVYRRRDDGPHAEMGCGSLLFTAHLYGEDLGRDVVLIDQSVRMLRLARRRLRKRWGRVPAHVTLVRGDARDLRLRGGWASTVLAMHVLHVVRERAEFLRTLRALVREPDGIVGLTSLFLAGGRGDVFLRFLAAAGELSPGLRRDELEGLLPATLGPSRTEAEGSMSFITSI